MTQTATDIVTGVTAVGAAITGGILFAFSTAVMRALTTLPVAQGITAMQQINRAILNPLFLTVFGGTTVAAVAVMALTLTSGADAAVLRIVVCLCYLLGTFGITAAVNLPLNDRLAAVDPNSRDGADLWALYLRRWTRFNHLRVIAAAVSAITLTVSLLPT